MASQAEAPNDGVVVTDLFDGLAAAGDSMFVEPYQEDG